MKLTCSTVIIDTRAELGIEADPMAANVAVKHTTMTFPTERDNPCACHANKSVFVFSKRSRLTNSWYKQFGQM